MRRSWTRRRSSFRGRCLVRYGCEVSRQLLTARTSGLVLASSYLSTATPIEHSFALDKPLHTICLVLLLTGLLVVAVEAWPGRPHQPQLPARYVAIPLTDGHSRQHAEQQWTEAGLVGRRKPSNVKAVGALLAVLLFAICGRIGVFYRVLKDVECSGPSPVVCSNEKSCRYVTYLQRHQTFLPIVLALYHSIRHPHQPQYPAWSADSRPKTLLERVLTFTYGDSTRYIVPSILLSVSSFLVLVKTSALRSTYICPVSNSSAALIPTLQFVGFVLDTCIVQLLYRLVDDGISPIDDWSIRLEDGTSNNMLIGLTFTVCVTTFVSFELLTHPQASSLILVVTGIVVYPAMPEHRQWMLSLPSEYLFGLLRLSLMIPFMTFCFLKSVSHTTHPNTRLEPS